MPYFRRAFVALLVAACALPACFGGGADLQYHRTPAGHALAWQNVGAVPARFSLEEIGAHFDGAVEDAAAHLARYGVPPDQVEAQARAYRHVGYDAVRFAVDASGTGYASGTWNERTRTMQLAFWTRVKGDEVPPDAPEWTAYQWPQRPVPAWDWGAIPRAFPALGHELGHHFFGPRFEHGWVPPVVRPPATARPAFEATLDLDWRRDCVVRP